MTEYEVIIESMTPCGGEKHARKEIIEVEAESPEIYVRENGQHPIIEITKKPNGDVVILTGNGKGYIDRYTFTE